MCPTVDVPLRLGMALADSSVCDMSPKLRSPYHEEQLSASQRRTAQPTLLRAGFWAKPTLQGIALH